MSPFVLTLQLDEISLNTLNQLRQDYFPRDRNFLPAHVTLFHALPSEEKLFIQETLQTVCSNTPVLPLNFPQVRFLGAGVAIELDCPPLIQIRKQLARTWSDWLIAQDRQGLRPHVTIQNKVSTETARELYEELASEWKPLQGEGQGLLLWLYQGGPWKLIETFPFTLPNSQLH